MRTRRATSDDADAIHAVLASVGAESHEPSEAGPDDLVALLRSETGGAFVVSDAEGDVGAALFERQGDVFWLFRVAVIEPKRGRGAGKALITAVEAAARGAGVSAVFVQLAKDTAAHALFEALGYHKDNEERDVVAGRSITLVDLVKLVT